MNKLQRYYARGVEQEEKLGYMRVCLSSYVEMLEEELERVKADNERLQNACYSLVVGVFSSEFWDEKTGFEVREFLTNCGFKKSDLVLED